MPNRLGTKAARRADRLPWRRIGWGLAVAGALALLAVPLPHDPATIEPAVPYQAAPRVEAPAPPRALKARIDELVAGFDGRVGVAVRKVGEPWLLEAGATEPLPQMSVSKLWVAVSVLHAVDEGRMSMSQPVTVRREDLSIFHQPIRRFVGQGAYRTTVEKLLVGAITQSDNAANDVLMREAGGPGAVRAALSAKGMAGVGFADEERILQTGIAGLEWRPEFSFGRAFWTAREEVPDAERRRALEAYLAAPPDGATPAGIVIALDRLKRGELLSEASTAWLLSTMSRTQTGPSRLTAGLRPGWSIAHKTGTGQVLGRLATGYNDVGLLTAPDGESYAVAVMIAETRAPVPDRQDLMVAVAAAVTAWHDGLDPSAARPDL